MTTEGILQLAQTWQFSNSPTLLHTHYIWLLITITQIIKKKKPKKEHLLKLTGIFLFYNSESSNSYIIKAKEILMLERQGNKKLLLQLEF
jgi:hypothetical protein